MHNFACLRYAKLSILWKVLFWNLGMQNSKARSTGQETWAYLYGTNNNKCCCFVLTSYMYFTFSFSITSAQTRSFFSSSICSLMSRICLIAIYLASSLRTCSRTSGITFQPRKQRREFNLEQYTISHWCNGNGHYWVIFLLHAKSSLFEQWDTWLKHVHNYCYSLYF